MSNLSQIADAANVTPEQAKAVIDALIPLTQTDGPTRAAIAKAREAQSAALTGLCAMGGLDPRQVAMGWVIEAGIKAVIEEAPTND